MLLMVPDLKLPIYSWFVPFQLWDSILGRNRSISGVAWFGNKNTGHRKGTLEKVLMGGHVTHKGGSSCPKYTLTCRAPGGGGGRTPLSQAFPTSVTQVGPGKQNMVQRFAPLSLIHDSEWVQDTMHLKILNCYLGTGLPAFPSSVKQDTVQCEAHSALPVSRDMQFPKALGLPLGSASGIAPVNASA